jgi:uncharacterized membrane protein
MKLVHALNAALLLGMIGLSIYVYPQLPERIPVHFGADGTPDSWSRRTLLTWLVLPLVGTASTAVMYGVARFMPQHPRWFNMPDRKKFLELPSALQRRVIGAVADMMYVMALTLLVMVSAMQYGAWQSAQTGLGSGWMVAGALVALVATPLQLAFFWVHIQRRQDAAWREYRTRTAVSGR